MPSQVKIIDFSQWKRIRDGQLSSFNNHWSSSFFLHMFLSECFYYAESIEKQTILSLNFSRISNSCHSTNDNWNERRRSLLLYIDEQLQMRNYSMLINISHWNTQERTVDWMGSFPFTRHFQQKSTKISNEESKRQMSDTIQLSRRIFQWNQQESLSKKSWQKQFACRLWILAEDGQNNWSFRNFLIFTCSSKKDDVHTK